MNFRRSCKYKQCDIGLSDGTLAIVLLWQIIDLMDKIGTVKL